MKKLFVLGLSIFSTLQAQQTILHCGQLFDAKRGKFLKAQSIIVEGNRIKVVVKGYEQANQNDRTIDLKNKTVLPGFIDMHVHIEGETNNSSYIKRWCHKKRLLFWVFYLSTVC